MVKTSTKGIASQGRTSTRRRSPWGAFWRYNLAVITLIGVEKRYGDVVAVAGVALEVAEGEVLALVGGSGSGKTTTLKMINRLVEASAGKVLVQGRDVMEQPAHLLRRSIGYVFQGVGLFPHLSVGDNIAVVPSLLGWPAPKVRARVREMLRLVELETSMAERRPDELSGGQQQRVGVARALAAEPAILLLDECFGALDPITRDRLQGSFSALRAELGFTAVFVTHDMAEALRVADRIAVMADGALLQVGTAKELLEEPAHPHVTALLETPKRQAQELFAHLGGDRG